MLGNFQTVFDEEAGLAIDHLLDHVVMFLRKLNDEEN